MDVTIRQIHLLPTLIHWRREILENAAGAAPSKRMVADTRRYYQDHIADGSYIAVMAEADGVGVGFGAISITEELPSPDNPSGRCARLTDVYVQNEYRSKGIGQKIVRWLVDKAAQSGCGAIWLEADGALSLYRRAGFVEAHGIMKQTLQ